MDIPTWISLGTLAAGFFTLAITLYEGSRSRIHERKLEVLKVILEAAYKEYEYRTTQDLAEAKEKNKTAVILSFTEYIIFYSRISETITKKNASEEDIKNALSENKTLIDAYYKNRDIYRPEYHKTRS